MLESILCRLKSCYSVPSCMLLIWIFRCYEICSALQVVCCCQPVMHWYVPVTWFRSAVPSQLIWTSLTTQPKANNITEATLHHQKPNFFIIYQVWAPIMYQAYAPIIFIRIRQPNIFIFWVTARLFNFLAAQWKEEWVKTKIKLCENEHCSQTTALYQKQGEWKSSYFLISVK